MAAGRAAHPRAVRRPNRRGVPGLPAGHRQVRGRARHPWRRVQLHPDELDQAELPLDDVPLRVGDEGEPGGDARLAACGGRSSTNCSRRRCRRRGIAGCTPARRNGGGRWGGRRCGYNGTRIITRRGRSWTAGRSSWGCEDRHWRRSAGGRWWRSSICRRSWPNSADSWRAEVCRPSPPPRACLPPGRPGNGPSARAVRVTVLTASSSPPRDRASTRGRRNRDARQAFARTRRRCRLPLREQGV